MRKLLSFVLVGSLSMCLSACGGGEKASEKTATTPPPAAQPDVQVVVIRPVGDEMKYETTEFTVKAGTQVRVVMENVATQLAMQHNVVITRPGSNTDEVGLAAVQAGEAGGYIPKHDAVLFYTPLAKPGETTQVEFTAPAPGDYPYVCAFPGHYATMKGVMHSTP
jgi:azurin